VQYILTPEHLMNPYQKAALSQLRTESRVRLGWTSVSQAVSVGEMQRLLSLYRDLFFFGTHGAAFSWVDLSAGNVLGRTYGADGSIVMDPGLVGVAPSCCSERAWHRRRLGTLLYEAVHCLFARYVCKLCPTYVLNVANARGHGRAFVLVLTAVREAMERLLDEEIAGDTWWDWQVNWNDVVFLPSGHDLEEWAWLEKGWPKAEKKKRKGWKVKGKKEKARKAKIWQWQTYRL
jgi:hypothetical protein